MKGCHVEKPSCVSAERPEMWLSLLVSPLSSNLASWMDSKPEITGFHSYKVGCESGKFSSDSLRSGWLQEMLLLVGSSLSQLSFSSSSEK